LVDWSEERSPRGGCQTYIPLGDNRPASNQAGSTAQSSAAVTIAASAPAPTPSTIVIPLTPILSGLSESATVTFTFTEPVSVRKVGTKCVAQTNKNEHKHRCTRTVTAGTLTFSAHAGTNRVRFEGLISKHKKLKPGNYTLTITAIDAEGAHSASKSLRFTIDG
jgi:hypothetical protein